MLEWSSDTLWNKAVVYTKMAFEADPDGPLFPLLASFSLELLGKAALSKVHPVLIADPRQEGAAVLYAFNVPIKDPKTIVAKTVFSRVRQIVPEFTDEDEAYCNLMADRRNKELHTGEMAYQNFGTGVWLPEYYRALKLLCEFLGRDAAEILGHARAAEAAEMTLGETARVTGEVARSIGATRAVIATLRPNELESRRRDHQPAHNWNYIAPNVTARSTECPACGSNGLLYLKEIGERPPEIFENVIYVDTIYTPKEFACGVCELKLSGTQELKVAGLADQVTRSAENSPIDYFDIAVAEDWHEDYGNE